ncbi:MAG: amino acid ABC transporter substrate-binding protein [Actinomycetota bacterium]|nr:amino acid ABC transporter substrate-binding protein [Actinomycetota bacterium]
MRTERPGLLLAVLALVVAGCTTDGGGQAAPPGGEAAAGGGQAGQPRQEDDGGLLRQVRSRGRLVCGVNAEVPGFGFTDEQGNFSGFDVDYCKVIAAAILGDAEAVDYRPLSTEQRFTALQSGEIDVLSRNTTYTASRDGTEGAAFVTTTFYDGQAMMVKADSQFRRLEDMQRSPICVLSGTTTELNLASRFAAGRIAYEPVPFEDNETLQQAFDQDRCDGWTSDRSQLAGVRSNRPNPNEYRILDEIFSKEPLGTVVREGDQDWFDAVNWAVIATIQAEEFGVTSGNVEQMKDSEDPEIRRFLGRPGGDDNAVFDPGLGLDPAFAVDVISQVGNYAEIYDRNVGPDTPLGLERGLNALWTDGGLHYAPPYR